MPGPATLAIGLLLAAPIALLIRGLVIVDRDLRDY